MKGLLFILLLTHLITHSQDKWTKLENDLWELHMEKKITQEEWHQKIQVEAGEITNRLSVWCKRTEKIINPQDKGVILRFTKDFLKEMDNGNIYRKMILKNDSKHPLVLQRIDATIGGIKEYFLINGKWIVNRSNGYSSCGNSYFKQTLKPYNQIELELSNGGLLNGDIEVDYKITFTSNQQIYESNIIKVKLYKNQIKRLKKSKRKKILSSSK